MKKDISAVHQESKQESYWANLTSGNTSQYKEKVIAQLLKNYVGTSFPRSILDVGCGTCDIAFRYRDLYSSEEIACLDYDEKVLDRLKDAYPDPNIQWICADVFKLEESNNRKFDLIFLLDMVHEIYSFYGRPSRDLAQEIDHKTGKEFVRKLLDNVCFATNHNGAIIITDNLVCEEDGNVVLEIKTSSAREAVKYFFANYPSKKMNNLWKTENSVEMNSRDLCILLTQYNKIKSNNWDRWNVEKMEIHQYFTAKEYKEYFQSKGFTCEVVAGMPDDAALEWNEDFKVSGVLDSLPLKRVTVLASRK